LISIRSALLAALALGLASLAWRDAAVSYWAGAAPASAPQSFADNPRIAVARRDTVVPGAKLERDELAGIVTSARSLLHASPLEPQAIRQIALAEAQLDQADPYPSLRLAERLSRRDARTQIALMQDAAAKADYSSALGHLDNLLQITPSLGNQLFPVLAPLVADPVFSRPLLKYADRRWLVALIVTAIGKLDDPLPIANLIVAGHIPLKQEAPQVLAQVLERLVSVGDYDTARAVAIRAGKASPAVFDDFRLTDQTVDPALLPLTWKINSDDSLQARYISGRGIEGTIQPSSVATLAQRTMHLPAGTYDLRERTGGFTGGTNVYSEWRVSCGAASAGEPILRAPIPIGTELQTHNSSFRIPSGCATQYWRINIRTEEGQIPAHFQIVEIHLSRRS
jgi:hypothetical protein